ncbi:MAG: NUDIX domain-containing protein [Myxococcota bacterium]|nr:NUDIX domain-containing protein [Myxococcota bacterium]
MAELPETLKGCLDASAVILIRDSDVGPEVFLVQRHSKSKFMAGAYVFPGGKVDPADCSPAPEGTHGLDEGDGWLDVLDVTPGTRLTKERALGFCRAACRELHEEAGVDLGIDTKGHGASALTYYAHWVTPSFEKRRFDTRFFVAQLPAGQNAVHDSHECVDSRWVSFGKALKEQAAGLLLLPPPTLKIIAELSNFENCRELLEYASRVVVEAWMPKAVKGGEEGEFTILLPWDTAYEATVGDSLALADAAGAAARTEGVSRLELVDGRWKMLPRWAEG